MPSQIITTTGTVVPFSIVGKTNLAFKAWSAGGNAADGNAIQGGGGGGGGCYAEGLIDVPFIEAEGTTFLNCVNGINGNNTTIFTGDGNTPNAGLLMLAGTGGEDGNGGLGGEVGLDDFSWVTLSNDGGNGAACDLTVGGGGGGAGGPDAPGDPGGVNFPSEGGFGNGGNTDGNSGDGGYGSEDDIGNGGNQYGGGGGGGGILRDGGNGAGGKIVFTWYAADAVDFTYDIPCQDNTDEFAIADDIGPRNDDALFSSENSASISALDGPGPQLPRSFSGFVSVQNGIYVQLNTPIEIGPTDIATIQFWAKRVPQAGNEVVIDDIASTTYIAIYNNPAIGIFMDNGVDYATWTPFSVAGVVTDWHHYAFVFNPSSTAILYVDGIEQEYVDFSPSRNSPFIFDRFLNAFNGLFCGLKVYTSARTQAQILAQIAYDLSSGPGPDPEPTLPVPTGTLRHITYFYGKARMSGRSLDGVFIPSPNNSGVLQRYTGRFDDYLYYPFYPTG